MYTNKSKIITNFIKYLSLVYINHFTVKHDYNNVINLFYYRVTSQLLRMTYVFTHRNLQMFGPRLNKY